VDDAVREVAVAYAAERFPLAELVVVAGSSADVRRPRSDIDLLVIGPAAMFPGSAIEDARTERFRGELFEVFASTPEAFREHQVAGVRRFRPVSGQLLADGVVVLDRHRHDDLVAWNRALLDAGPAPSAVELAERRYSVTNTLDDLLDADDPIEAAVLAWTLFERLAELLLLANGRWLGSGRWLLRRLRQWDRSFADELGRALAERDVEARERSPCAHSPRLAAG
jgi:predicted nucleotidyltransferase